MTYISFLMGGNGIEDSDLEPLNIEIVEKEVDDGDRKLEIPDSRLDDYLQLIKNKLADGFWNEVVGESKIVFVFKYKDGSIRQYTLGSDNESEIDELCAKFNNQPSRGDHNVYKWLAKNSFYKDFMNKHYSELINR